MPNDCFSVVYGNYLLNLEVNKKYRIDFIYSGQCVVPQGTYLNVPGVATDNVYIRCDGDAPIIYSLNAPNSEVVQGGYMVKGKDRDLKFSRQNLKSVNIFVVNDGASLLADVAIDTLI